MLQLHPTPVSRRQVGEVLLEVDTGAEGGAEAADSGIEPATSTSHPAAEEAAVSSSQEPQAGPWS